MQDDGPRESAGVVLRSFNINYCVRVRLAPQAVDAYRARAENFNRKFPNFARPVEPPVDKDGYCRAQLWDLMTLIGPLCGAGSYVIENCEMVLEFPADPADKDATRGE